LDNNGTFETPGQSVSFSAAGLDGPSAKTIKVQVVDNGGLTAVASATVVVNNVPPTVNTPSVAPEPSTEGSAVVASAGFSDPGVNDAPFTCTVNYGDGSGDLAGTVSANVCTGPSHTYSTFGAYAVVIKVTDKDHGTGSNTVTHTVIYNFGGFFGPVDNLPAINLANAGSAIPVKFTLGGNKGLNIFASGYPKSEVIVCNSAATVNGSEETRTAGASSLAYDASTGQYIYVWKTDKAWAGTCRQFVIKLNDGTFHRANFMFTK
jgi:hypothetical protein